MHLAPVEAMLEGDTGVTDTILAEKQGAPLHLRAPCNCRAEDVMRPCCASRHAAGEPQQRASSQRTLSSPRDPYRPHEANSGLTRVYGPNSPLRMLTRMLSCHTGPADAADDPPGHDRPDPQVVPEEETPEDTEAIEKEKEKIKQRKVQRDVRDGGLRMVHWQQFRVCRCHIMYPV